MKGSHQRGQSGNLCSIPDGFKGQLTLESQINGKIRGSKVLREKTVRAENLGNTSCDLLLALQRDHIPLAWGDWSGIQDQVGAACSISSQPQISSCYLRNWKACKKKHKTDLFLMNTSQNLTLPPSFRVKPNTILVWGVDGQADGASFFPISPFFSGFHFLVSLRTISPPCAPIPRLLNSKLTSLYPGPEYWMPQKEYFEVWLSVIQESNKTVSSTLRFIV